MKNMSNKRLMDKGSKELPTNGKKFPYKLIFLKLKRGKCVADILAFISENIHVNGNSGTFSQYGDT